MRKFCALFALPRRETCGAFLCKNVNGPKCFQLFSIRHITNRNYMKALKFIVKGIINLALITIGTLALFVILGEEAPGHELSVIAFFGEKILAGVIIYVCWKIGEFLNPEWAKELHEEETQKQSNNI